MQVQSSFDGLDPECLFCPLQTVQVLLQSQQSSLMSSMLPDLYERVPVVRCKLLLTIMTLRVLFYKFYDLSLLYFCVFVDDTDELYFDPHPFAMRLSPYKFSRFDLRFP